MKQKKKRLESELQKIKQRAAAMPRMSITSAMSPGQEPTSLPGAVDDEQHLIKYTANAVIYNQLI